MSIQPLYTSKRANAPIALGSAPVEITASSGATVRGEGKAFLRLVPRCGVQIATTFPGGSGASLFMADNLRIRYGSDSRPLPVIALRSKLSNAGFEADYQLLTGELALCRDRRVRLNRAIFHILNFPEFFSVERHKSGAGERRLRRAVLSHTPWTIEIQALQNTADLVKQLKAEGGHAITHVGALSRRDGRTFTIAAAEQTIDDLHRFLSFACGRWTAIFGVVGYNPRNEIVYEGWQEQSSSPWGGTFRWFDPHHGQTLAQVYDGFVHLRRDKAVGDAVDTALYWYLRSNRGGDSAGIDGGLILSQAALERLAFAILRSAGLATGGSREQQMRRAFQHQDIPIALSKATPRLYADRGHRVWRDGPEAITKIRNKLVHPTNYLPVKLNSFHYFEAWQLAQWYVEMTILQLTGYIGVYFNRLKHRWAGQVEAVPWTAPKNKQGRVLKRRSRTPIS